MSTNKSTWHVEMTCAGCARAITNVLQKTPGVESVECDVENKKVSVVGSATDEEISASIKKTGKTFSKLTEE